MGRSTLAGRWAECLAVVWILLHSDTLFSALCIEALRDETARNSLLEEAKAGRFLLSDAFPYRADELFLPKPLIRTEQGLRQMQDPGQRKLFKKLTYLPASLWDAYLDLWREAVHSTRPPACNSLKTCPFWMNAPVPPCAARRRPTIPRAGAAI